jgi:hypothetical protein
MDWEGVRLWTQVTAGSCISGGSVAWFSERGLSLPLPYDCLAVKSWKCCQWCGLLHVAPQTPMAEFPWRSRGVGLGAWIASIEWAQREQPQRNEMASDYPLLRAESWD